MRPLRVRRGDLEKCAVWLLVTASQQVVKLSNLSGSHSEAAEAPEGPAVDITESPTLLVGLVLQNTNVSN